MEQRTEDEGGVVSTLADVAAVNDTGYRFQEIVDGVRLNGIALPPDLHCRTSRG